VLADAGPGRTSGPMWTLLWTFLNDRVRRSLVPAMQRQGLPFTEHAGEWRSEPPPSGAALVDLSNTERAEQQARITSLESELSEARLDLERWHTSVEAHRLATILEQRDEARAEVKELESEVARLREEAELEQAVRETLSVGERYGTLMIRRSSSENRWMASWLSSDDPSVLSYAGMLPADRDTLPALLRAILEVEKGGSGG
jgi:hypothetical protein